MAKRARTGDYQRVVKAMSDAGDANSGTDRHEAMRQGRGALGDFAEDLGTFLGNTERKASEWLSQRQNMTEQLTRIRDKADSLLSQLGITPAAPSAVRRKPRVRRDSAAASSRRSGKSTLATARVVSPETRAKMADAARRRWAAKTQGRDR